jgi:outer membrane PBP1 activator LpoA protein
MVHARMVVIEGSQCSRRPRRTHGGTVLLFLCAFILGACAEAPPRVLDPVAMEQDAEAARRDGRLAEATDLYLRLAAAASGPRRSEYLLSGAELLRSQRNYAQARHYADQARRDATAEQNERITLLLAEIALDQGEAELALTMLEPLRASADVSLRQAASLARGRALFGLNRFEAAVRELAERELWLESATAILENQRVLWAGLASYRDQPLPATGDPIVDGWLALAPVAARNETDEALRQSLLGWRANYPNHPGASVLLASLLRESRGEIGFPEQIALLLPLSSPQRVAALALQDGFMAALLQEGRSATRLRVYDTAALGAATAYLNAQLDGADFIVGPLLRPEVEEVAAQQGFVPTLALNYVQEPRPMAGSFFQFALSPEDEAREVARRAIAEGATTALALVVENDWGVRLLRSFEAEFTALGGRLLRTVSYDRAARDFAAPITTLLNLSHSTERYRRLAANLGVPLQFEPRRRNDADMLFIAADSAVARLLRPQLRFHYAGDIPTYATSEIYQPGGSNNDADLNGLYFTDMPWVLAPDADAAELKTALQAYWPQRFAGQGVRFYAMGYDAYRLIGLLYGPEPAFAAFAGASGELYVDGNGQIHRRLPVAQFRGGRPVVLESTNGRFPELAQLGR